MDKGYYWIKLKGEDEWAIGYYKGNVDPHDNLPLSYPWQYIGSDEIYANDDVIKVQKPKLKEPKR